MFNSKMIGTNSAGTPIEPFVPAGPVSGATLLKDGGDLAPGLQNMIFSPDGSILTAIDGSAQRGVSYSTSNWVTPTYPSTRGTTNMSSNFQGLAGGHIINEATGNQFYAPFNNSGGGTALGNASNYFGGGSSSTNNYQTSTKLIDMRWSKDGKYMFARASSSDTQIRRYDCPSAYTPDFTSFTTFTAPVAYRFLWISNDGLKLYLMDAAATFTVREYNISTAWDLSSVSFVSSFSDTVNTFSCSFDVARDGSKFTVGRYGNFGQAITYTRLRHYSF